jgi:hypothetical protein
MSAMAKRLAALEAGNTEAAIWLQRRVGKETRAEVLARHGLPADAVVNWIERRLVTPLFDSNGAHRIGTDGRAMFEVEDDVDTFAG